MASGTWSEAECGNHINYLELLAVFKALTIVKESLREAHIHVITDNTTVMFYLNKMRGTQSAKMWYLTLDVWDLCVAHIETLPKKNTYFFKH